MSKLSCSHLLSIENLSHDDVMLLMGYAAFLENKLEQTQTLDLLSGKQLSTLFFESSTRTRLSFESAMYRLGGHVMSVDGSFSSVVKGETLEDMGAIMSGYSDIVVMRHSEEGSVARFATHSNIPVINAGDGVNQHPTQALLDLYTILSEKESLSGLTIGFLGDMKHARTIKSLLPLLQHYNINFVFISHPDLQITAEMRESLALYKGSFLESDNLLDVLPDLDVLYATRLQEERFLTKADALSYKSQFCITPDVLSTSKKDMILMHPLPRLDEIHPDCDRDNRSVYFKQARNAVFVRMALLWALSS